MIRIRSRVLAYALCLLSVLPISALGQINLNPTVSEGFGIDIHAWPQGEEAKMLVDSGARWIRRDLTWEAIEQTKGQYNFSRYDQLMETLQRYNLHALFILGYANKLYDGGSPPHTDAGRQAFAQWAAASVQHFQGRGVLWEMWNEPDVPGTAWKMNVEDYIKLALAVGEAVRKIAPNEAYIGPATSLFSYPFLESCFKAGLLKYWSAVSVHPYRPTQGPETATVNYEYVRGLIKKYAPPNTQIPIICSEWGYSTKWGVVGDQNNQARIAVRTILSNLANRIPLTVWYDWAPEPDLALVNPPLHPTPAYAALRALTSTLGGYRFDRQLPASSGDYLLQFTDGEKTSIAGWTTGPPHAVAVPLNNRFRAIGTMGEAVASPPPSGRGISITLTQAPQYVVPQ